MLPTLCRNHWMRWPWKICSRVTTCIRVPSVSAKCEQRNGKTRFPLPEFTARVHGPSSRPVNLGAFFDTGVDGCQKMHPSWRKPGLRHLQQFELLHAFPPRWFIHLSLLVYVCVMYCMVFGHIAWLDDTVDAKKILTALPPEDWKRPPGRPRITWMKTFLNDLESHNWLKQSISLRIACYGSCWLRVALCTLSCVSQNVQ